MVNIIIFLTHVTQRGYTYSYIRNRNIACAYDTKIQESGNIFVFLNPGCEGYISITIVIMSHVTYDIILTQNGIR